MNIFATADSPIISAANLDDKRIVKMVLETAQMLSSVAHRYNIEGPWYKPTHTNHPCTLWAGDCSGNYVWLCAHGIALAREYQKRFNKQHKSLGLIDIALDHAELIPLGSRQAFANCTPYKSTPSVTAYRQYLNDKWQADKRPPKWTNTCPPPWYVTYPQTKET